MAAPPPPPATASGSSAPVEVRSPPEGRSRPEVRGRPEGRSARDDHNPIRDRSPAAAVRVDSLPPEWEVMKSRNTGATFYYNHTTQKSQWHAPGSRPASPPAERCIVTSSVENVEPRQIIRCSHILIKHRNSKRPFNWRDKRVVRSMPDARKMAYDLRVKLANGESFEDAARTYSDCSSARYSGDLGRFGRGDRQRDFEKIAFSLNVGELSEVVESCSGFHILLRIE